MQWLQLLLLEVIVKRRLKGRKTGAVAANRVILRIVDLLSFPPLDGIQPVKLDEAAISSDQ